MVGLWGLYIWVEAEGPEMSRGVKAHSCERGLGHNMIYGKDGDGGWELDGGGGVARVASMADLLNHYSSQI